MKEKTNYKLINLLILSATLVLVPNIAISGEFNQTLSIATIFNPVCYISANDINFGTIIPAKTGTTISNGKIITLCTIGTYYTIKFSKGYSGTYTNRTMKGSIGANTDKLTYNLYMEPTLQNILGDGTSGTYKLSGMSFGFIQNTTIYAKLSNNQFIRPDNYTDILVATITY